jgi:ATP-dependent DNA ligase
VADETGRPRFYELLRVPRSACYVAFDITDLGSLPLDERRRRLQGILPKRSPIVSEALSVAGRGRELFELMCINDLEGVVAKRLADPYGGRVRWLKRTRTIRKRKAGPSCSTGRRRRRPSVRRDQPFAGRAEQTGSPRQR